MAVQDYRVNHRIRVPEVRLVDEDGEQLGVVQTKDAKARAQNAGLDLVEVSPNARPPVCKIMDFGKFKYEQRKKEKRGGGKKVVTSLKELRVRPAIDDHDLSYRLENGRKFLGQGHKVQVVCIFRGRQMAHPEHGYDVMKKVAKDLEEVCKVERPAKMMGRRMTMLLSPVRPGTKPQPKQGSSKSRSAAPSKARTSAPSSGLTPGPAPAPSSGLKPGPAPAPAKPPAKPSAPEAS
ncbi:MAG: translation initiation factor IF-3 [Planctomycetota bacterium]